jgi:hypothetical protein
VVTGCGAAIGAAEPDDNQVTVAQADHLADRRNEFHRLAASLSIRHRIIAVLSASARSGDRAAPLSS